MARNRELELGRLAECRACNGYWLTPLRSNACCRHCGMDGAGLPVQLINDPPDQPFLNGPESNCPLGKWAGVSGIDATQAIAEDKIRLEGRASRAIGLLQPIMGLVKDDGEATAAQKVDKAFDEMVAAGVISTTLREEIEKQLAEPTI